MGLNNLFEVGEVLDLPLGDARLLAHPLDFHFVALIFLFYVVGFVPVFISAHIRQSEPDSGPGFQVEPKP